MPEPGKRDEQDKSPLERVTGENDVHPEEERGERAGGAERSGGGGPGTAPGEGPHDPDSG
ncbi:hypothetical protein [Streptomyces sp. NPDC050856]|uniref:hypothetical protein n=1 Tax=Streptomyces sp. NPDC050856 TaxID=3154939 RepID=UPI0034021D81